ncbi:MAG: hypothetical protein ACLR7W_11150 [Ruminococcus sp.]
MMQMERKSDIVRLPFFGGMNHYDNNGHKVGESRPGFFGGLNHYDDKGHKRGHSNPGVLGGFNHYG